MSDDDQDVNIRHQVMCNEIHNSLWNWYWCLLMLFVSLLLLLSCGLSDIIALY